MKSVTISVFDDATKIILMSSTPIEFLSTIKTLFKKNFEKVAGLGQHFALLDNKDVQLLNPVTDTNVMETDCAHLINVELTV